jgi:peptidoglycan hydrolase-like protein with peptidoglycan-binding domain
MKFVRLKFRGRRLVLSTVGGLVGALILATGLALPANAAIGTLGPGSSGTQVVLWQQDLNYFILIHDTCHPTLTVDGQYGPVTTNATVCFQHFFKLSADGVEGPQTRGQMCTFLVDFGEGLTQMYKSTCT